LRRWQQLAADVMTITIEQQGATDCQPLVLVHGWGFGSAVWRPLIAQLQSSFSVYVINLPGYGGNRNAPAEWTLAALLEQFSDQCRMPALWCGWSLGGRLAVAHAAAAPERVAGVVTLGANARFVASQAWPQAMPKTLFEQFAVLTNDSPHRAIQRFAGLVTMGAVSARLDQRQLQQLTANQPSPDRTTLLASLRLLQQLDLRAVWSRLSRPVLHLLGAADALVPATVAPALVELNPRSQVEILAGASHMPWLADPQGVAGRLKRIASEVSCDEYASDQ